MSAITVQGGMHRRTGWWPRLKERVTVMLEPEPAEDWSEPALMQERPQPAPATMPQSASEPHEAPVSRPHHPPFGQQPAQMSHVLDRMIHKLVDLRSDPSMTAIKAIEALRPLDQELSGYARQEFDQQRRMQRNQVTAQAQAAVLADAVLRGEGQKAAAQAQDAIVGRAVHVGDPEPTQVMEPITDDMPDPRTVARPREVNPGDVEQQASPVHVDDDVKPAVPSASAVAEASDAGTEADR